MTGDELRTLRLQLRLLQRDVAHVAGCKEHHVGRAEKRDLVPDGIASAILALADDPMRLDALRRRQRKGPTYFPKDL